MSRPFYTLGLNPHPEPAMTTDEAVDTIRKAGFKIEEFPHRFVKWRDFVVNGCCYSEDRIRRMARDV